MKKITLFVGIAALCLAGAAMGDSLAVNNTAAMGGSGTACSGSNCGLEVLHDNSSAAYVQDDTPSGETIYRFEFLYNPTAIGATGSNDWIMTTFGAMGANPRPNNGANPCPLNPGIPVFPARIMAFATGPGQSVPAIRMTAMTNFCGVVGTPLILLSQNTDYKVCGYIEVASPIVGGIAAISPASACPAAGDAAYKLIPGGGLSNLEHAVDFARMGNLAINPYGAGENGSVYFDEFASFRTLAP